MRFIDLPTINSFGSDTYFVVTRLEDGTPVDRRALPTALDVATGSTSGLMSAADKTLVNSFAGVNTTPIQRGTVRDVYIAVRTDGRLGSGTLEDPFDGSNREKFDAVMTMLAGTSASDTSNYYKHIHLESGTYFTKGNDVDSAARLDQWFVRPGWVISGAGAQNTVIKIVARGTDTPARHLVALTNNDWTGVPLVQYFDVEFKDFKIDCNGSNHPSRTAAWYNGTAGVVGAIFITSCSNLRWQNLHITGHSSFEIYNGTDAVRELFAVSANYCQRFNVDAVHVYGQYQNGDGGTTILQVGGHGQPDNQHGVIKNCYVDGAVSTGTVHTATGLMASGTNVWVRNNIVRNCFIGFYHDTGTIGNSLVEDNYYSNCMTGIYFLQGGSPGQYTVQGDTIIRHNIFEQKILTSSPGYLTTGILAGYTVPAAPAEPYRNQTFIVKDNFFRYGDNGFWRPDFVGSHNIYAMSIESAKRIVIENNVVDYAQTQPIRVYSYGGLVAVNNRNLFYSGTHIPLYTQVLSGTTYGPASTLYQQDDVRNTDRHAIEPVVLSAGWGTLTGSYVRTASHASVTRQTFGASPGFLAYQVPTAGTLWVQSSSASDNGHVQVEVWNTDI